MATRETVIEWIGELTSKWETTYIRVRQDGKYRSLPLSQVEDQGAILTFVKEQLKEFALTLPKKGKGKGKKESVEEVA